VKHGELADGALAELGALRKAPRVHVGLHRDEELGRRVGKLGEHGLTSEDDEL
jgi:hypothetical protein